MDSLLEYLLYAQGPVPYVAAFSLLLACGLGLPIPEDITLFAMGLLSYYGLADVRISIAVCLVGVLLGDSIIYFIGRHYGVKLARKGIFAKVLHPERMDRTRKLFHKWGNRVIFAARFMPGLRAPTYFSAGTLHLPYGIFIFYDGLAASVSVPAFVGVFYLFGDHVDRVFRVVRGVQNGIVFVIAGLIALLVVKHYALRAKG